MKYLPALLFFLAACNGGPKAPVSGSQDSATVTSGNTSTTDTVVGDAKFNADSAKIVDKGQTNAPSNPSGTDIVFVGVFATWHNPGGDDFDGLYDSTQTLFTLCSSNKCEHVPATEISYDKNASCDTTQHKRVMLFEMDSLGNLNPNGRGLNIIGDHGYILGDKQRTVKLSPAVIDRINTTKITKYLRSNVKVDDGSQKPLQENIKPIEEIKPGQDQPTATEEAKIKMRQPANRAIMKAASKFQR